MPVPVSLRAGIRRCRRTKGRLAKPRQRTRGLPPTARRYADRLIGCAERRRWGDNTHGAGKMPAVPVGAPKRLSVPNRGTFRGPLGEIVGTHGFAPTYLRWRHPSGAVDATALLIVAPHHQRAHGRRCRFWHSSAGLALGGCVDDLLMRTPDARGSTPQPTARSPDHLPAPPTAPRQRRCSQCVSVMPSASA